MLASLIALALAQSAAAATPSTEVRPTGEWQVAGTSRGCMAHAAYDGGTVLSVIGMPARGGIGFLLQNRGWTDLEDGGVYALRIRFDEGGDWTIPAVARLRIDRDGPGLFFAMPPGADGDGRNFVAEFAESSGMAVESGGATVDRLALTGSYDATVALARCMRGLVGGGAPGNPFGDGKSAETALRI